MREEEHGLGDKHKKFERIKDRIEHTFHKLRSGKTRQQQHEEAMSGNYKSKGRALESAKK